jgi:hypothetical protein
MPQFIGVLEKEYASWYLENLNILPTQQNVKMILKRYPLKQCTLAARWNSNFEFWFQKATACSLIPSQLIMWKTLHKNK